MVCMVRWLIIVSLIVSSGGIKILAEEITKETVKNTTGVEVVEIKETVTEEPEKTAEEKKEEEKDDEEEIVTPTTVEEEVITPTVVEEGIPTVVEEEIVTPVTVEEVVITPTVEEEIVTPTTVEEVIPTVIEEEKEVTVEEEKLLKEAKKKEELEEEKKEEEKEPLVEEIEGIDTVDLEVPAGNWLLKRIWWEKAKNKFNKIRLAVNQVADAPMRFFAMQNDLEKTVLDPFYREVGFEQGELQEIINTLIERMEQEREQEGELDLEERSFLNTLLSERKRIEQLRDDISAVSKLDSNIDEALTLLLKQVNQARTYENQAWKQFDTIAHELSDQKAQELYYGMDALLNNIQEIDVYTKTKFFNYFNTIVSTAKEQIDRIKESIKELKQKGVDFKEQIEKLEEEKPTEPMEAEEAEPKEPARGWLSRFWSWITGR